MFAIQAVGKLAASAAEADEIRRASAVMRVSIGGAAIARELGATVIDAQDAVRLSDRPAPSLFGPGSDVHLSVEGSALFARYLFEKGPWPLPR